jgi:AcrR family transcriptional regulator
MGWRGFDIRHPLTRFTRDKLLKAAFEEIYRRGFQAASLDTILAKAGVTKGALYHHFPDKGALGYAVVRGFLLQRWSVGSRCREGGPGDSHPPDPPASSR